MMAEQPASADNKTDITDSTNNNSSTKPASSDQGSQRLNISPVVGQTGAAASISGETPHGAPGAATTGAGSISVANATVGGAAASGTPGASGWKGKTPAVPKQALMVPSPQEGAVSGGSGNIGIKGEVSGMGVDAENDVAAARMEGNSREVDGMDIGVHDGVVPNDSTRKDSTVVKRDSTDATSKIATVSNNVTVSGEANVGGAKAGPVGEQDSKAVGARVPIDVGIVIAAASGNDAEEPMEVDRQLLIESETKREALQLQASDIHQQPYVFFVLVSFCQVLWSSILARRSLLHVCLRNVAHVVGCFSDCLPLVAHRQQQTNPRGKLRPAKAMEELKPVLHL